MRRTGFFTSTDLRYTLRLLAKRPGSTLLAVLVLAGGLGLSIFTFTMSYTFAYKSIPLTNGDSIVRLCTGERGSACGPFRAFEFAHLRDEILSLENVGISTASRVTIDINNMSTDVVATQTEWNMFQLSETDALLGRTLQAFDHQADAEAVAVLGYDLWKGIFNGADNIVNMSVSIGGQATRIVGVMPEGYKFPATSQLWLPVSFPMLAPVENNPVFVSAYARLKENISRRDASAEIDSLMRRNRALYPLDSTQESGQNIDQLNSAHVLSLPMALMGGSIGVIAMGMLNLLATMVFLLVCINVGTLLLARTNERLKDVSIRVALGAPANRLLIQTMSENIAIYILGGVLALLLAGLFLDALNGFMTSTVVEDIPFWVSFRVDGSTLIAVLLFVLCTLGVTSLLPGWKIVNGDFNAVMRDGTRGSVGIKSSRFSKKIVIAAIILITLLLYAGTLAGSVALMYKQIYSARDSADLIGTKLELDSMRYTPARKLQFYKNLQEQLNRSAGIDDVLIFNTAGSFNVEAEGFDYALGGDRSSAIVQQVSGSLATVGGSLMEGRYLNDFDTLDSPLVVLISRSLAERLWPNQSATDQQLRIMENGPEGIGPWRRVAGIIGDTLISGQSLFTSETDAVYMPLSQSEVSAGSVYVKHRSNTNEAASQLRRTIAAIDPAVSVNITDLREEQGVAVRALNAGIGLIIGCGLFAFLVAMIGIFGLTSNSIVLRTQEIGTRRALGATDKMISRAFVINGSKQVLAGIGIAMIIASPVTYLAFSNASTDFLTIALPLGVALLIILFITLLMAVYYPIRKILQLEPIEALRHQ